MFGRKCILSCIHQQDGLLTAAERTPRRLLNRAERRDAILRAAATAFARQGFAATSMDAVANAAGITRLIVYRHFESKEALYEAVLTRIAGRLRTELELRSSQGPGPAQAVVEAMMTAAREDPDGFTLLIRHASREPQFAAFAAAVRSRAVQTAESMLASLDPDPVRRRWEAEVVVSWLNEAIAQWLEHGDPSRDAEAVAMTAAALRAMITAWRPGSA